MDINHYASEAMATANPDTRHDLFVAVLGLSSEAGEVAGRVQKLRERGQLSADGRFEDPGDGYAIGEELGDVLWRLAHCCEALGVSLNYLAALNLAKLEARYPDGFTAEGSRAKRDEKWSCPTCGTYLPCAGELFCHPCDSYVTAVRGEDAVLAQENAEADDEWAT